MEILGKLNIMQITRKITNWHRIDITKESACILNKFGAKIEDCNIIEYWWEENKYPTDLTILATSLGGAVKPSLKHCFIHVKINLLNEELILTIDLEKDILPKINYKRLQKIKLNNIKTFKVAKVDGAIMVDIQTQNMRFYKS